MTINKHWFFCCIFLICCAKTDYTTSTGNLYLEFCHDSVLTKSTLSILSFNRMQGTSMNSVSKVIEVTNPDVIGLQESYELGMEIADRFNYCFYGSKDNSVAILSKYPIEFTNDLYCKIILGPNYYINFFNLHLPAYPYQPYDIRDTLITTDLQAVHQAEQTRGLHVSELVNVMSELNDSMPVILTGDFNEPSHLDWIQGADNPTQFQFNSVSEEFTVDWPASNKMYNAGLRDAYREFFQNPISHPGYTWTPYYGVNEVHDRIDFIYYNNQIDLNDIFLVGPDNISDIIIGDFESDHRGVFAIFNVSRSCCF